MKLLSALGLTALTSLAGVSASSSTAEIVIKGNKFFYSNNGSEFFMKGIAYQQQPSDTSTFTDPLIDSAACKRDLPYLLELQTNVLRVYSVNISENHDECMNLFAENGIYIIADLSEPALSISRTDPSWTVSLYDRYTSVVDMMQNYTNTLGFFAGNEVTNNNTNTNASPYVKAAIRDVKAYISDKNYRSIPVGYSTNDDSATRGYLADYFTCGNTSVSADFYGINMYEWCGSDSTFSSSGYKDRTEEFSNFTVPVFFSEYGCNVPSPRVFDEVTSLFSTNMTDVWSGGIVYMYFEEDNDYGLVSIKSSTVKTLTDFNNLSKKINSVSPSGVNSNSWTATNTDSRSCPASTLADWKANTALPPTPAEGICECMVNSLSCIVDDSVSSDDYATLFSYVCGEINCDGVNGNGTSGEYGSYSFCSDADKLSFILNLYYIENDKSAAACSFSGSATLAGSSSTASSCSSALSQAGKYGTGSVSASVAATGTTVISDEDSTSSGSTSTSTSSSSGALAVAPVSAMGFKAGLALVGSIVLGFALVI